MKECKWCGEKHSKLAKSHIIPRFLSELGGGTLLIRQDDHIKRSPMGPYDENILCLKCEENFSDIDSLAADILINKFKEEVIPFNYKTDDKAVQINGKYRNIIKRFLIYTLWKASVSTRFEFGKVNLGIYEDKIKKAIINNEIFDIHDYSFFGARVVKPSGGYMSPNNKRNSGCNYYKLDFQNFIFEVKIDKRTTPSTYKDLAEAKHIIFPFLEETPEKRVEAMRKIVQEQSKWEVEQERKRQRKPY